MALVGGPALTPPAPQPGGSVQLTLNGIAGWRYTVSGSTDLVNWTPLTSFVATNASTQIVEPGSGQLQPPVLSGNGAVGRRSKAPSSEIRRKSEIRNPKSDGRVAHGISVQNGPLSGHEHRSGDVFVLMTTKGSCKNNFRLKGCVSTISGGALSPLRVA